MKSFERSKASWALALLGVLLWGGCSAVNQPPPADTGGDAERGGAMYDKFWKVSEVTAAEPTDTHPLWAMRPDQDSNSRTGADTWRCKECHGWDYKGIDGAYASGSHRTGIAGIFGSVLDEDEVFDLLKTDHGYGDAGLTDEDIDDLTAFVLEGLIDTDEIIDEDGVFTGMATTGAASYTESCMACHGADGLMTPPGADDDHEDFVGLVSNENPWEFQHKVRFGQPGTAMPAQFALLSLEGLADLSAHAQTLPLEAAPGGAGEAATGEAFYMANGCSACHGADATGTVGPSLVGADAETLLAKLDGTNGHGGGVVDGITQQNADDLAAWLATL